MKHIVKFCLFLLLLISPTFANSSTLQEIETERKVDQCLLLIQKRLAIMHEVAKTKWNRNLPIEDLAREEQILTELTKKASLQGLNEKWVRAFFQAQIEAAKVIQSKDFELWKQQNKGKFESVLDLKTDLRDYIDSINAELIESLSQISAQTWNRGHYVLTDPISTRATDHVDSQVWQLATHPLVQ